MAYSYYPGCSLHSTGIAYDKSIRATFKALGEELKELDDWNCCGATAYMSVKETVACVISARNLALAERTGLDLVAPCSACFTVLNKTRSFVRELPAFRRNVEQCLQEAGLRCRFETRVRHPLDVLMNDIGLSRIAQGKVRDLAGLRVACYYGCQIVRPERAVLEDPEVPMALDDLVACLGATPVDYPPKVRCCGGMLVATFEEVARRLCDELITRARDDDADCIVTTCPMCHANLELLQLRNKTNGRAAAPMPILYFTQLVGLALGCSEEEVGLNHNLFPLRYELSPVGEVRHEE
jgi:heterodisulfide reductase subunit B